MCKLAGRFMRKRYSLLTKRWLGLDSLIVRRDARCWISLTSDHSPSGLSFS